MATTRPTKPRTRRAPQAVPMAPTPVPGEQATRSYGSPYLSRKFLSFLAALLVALAGLVSGALTFPDFVQTVTLAAASYQAAEGVADAFGGRG